MPDFVITDPETGQKIKVTGDSPPSEQEIEQIFASMRPQQVDAFAGETPGVGGLESAATIITSAIAEPVAGLAGLGAALNPFREEGAGAATVEQVREALTFKPRTERGKANLNTIAETIQPLAGALEDLKTELGDETLKSTGSPILATLANVLPDATLELLGVGTGKRFARGTQAAADVDQAKRAAVASVREAEEATGIRQLTSDVLPPQTRTGKFLQAQGELVAGGQRAGQQSERLRAVEKLVDQFDVTEGANFEADIVQGVKNSIDAKKAAAGELFTQSTGELDKLGNVPLSNTKKFAQSVLDTELKKGTLGDEALISDMRSLLDAPEDLSFEIIKEIRSSVGKKLQAARQGAPVTGSSDVGKLSQTYKNLSRDMENFANTANPELAKRWKEADKTFSEFATGANKTGVRSLIKRGDATPEIVNQLLFSNKNSDIEFLANNLDSAGKQAAKQRVLQRIVEGSTGPDLELNVNGFQKGLAKHRNQIGKFFSPAERKAITSLREALTQTRRAQDAAVTTPTGQSVVPLFAVAQPQVLIPGVAQAIIEKPVLRNLIIKRKAAKSAKARNVIDQQLQQEIDKLGLIGAITAGTPLEQQEQQ